MRHGSVVQRVRARAGAALLEVLIAVTILGIAGGAVTALALDAGRLARHTRLMEEEMREASAFLDHVVLWGREDLDRRLGERPQGAWRLRIDRHGPSMYDIELRDSSSAMTLLRTQRFIPPLLPAEGADAAR